jgi:hypothetical protein
LPANRTINFGWGIGVIISVEAGVTDMVLVMEGNAPGDGELVRDGAMYICETQISDKGHMAR